MLDTSKIEEYLINNDFRIVQKFRKKFVQIPCAFDIETTSTYVDGEKVAFMYIWQFGIGDIIITGRYWSEFLYLTNIIYEIFHDIKKYDKNVYLPCYIHNFAFEYRFLVQEFPDRFEDSFFVKANIPLYSNFNNILQFRCSLLLTGKSLAKLSEDTKTKKLVGDLDYELVRHNKTPLTEQELQYCYNDVQILLEYIGNLYNTQGLENIPFTKTGYARKLLKEMVVGEDFFSSLRKLHSCRMEVMQINNYGEMEILHNCFTGGFTGANPMYVKKTLNQSVKCVDFASSYPSTVCEYFPNVYLETLPKMDYLTYQKYMKNHKIMFSKVIIKEMYAKKVFSTPLSFSKCISFDIDENERGYYDVNNGKLVHANNVEVFVSSIQFKLLELCYDMEGIEFEQVMVYDSYYLPKAVIAFVLDSYNKKTKLKGVDPIEYALAKEFVNGGFYGVAVTYPLKPEIVDGEDEFSELPLDVEKAVQNYNKKLINGNIIIPYQQGICISDYARLNLWKGIMECDDNFVYADTDSIYYFSNSEFDKWIDSYNSGVKDKMEKMCKLYDFPLDYWCPKGKNGVSSNLGYFDREGEFTKFKTLGAKKYLKTDKEGVIHSTIAGLTKNISKFFNEIDNPYDFFDDNMEIKPEQTNKLTHTIIRTEKECDIIDYLGNKEHITTKGGIHLEKAGFTVNMEVNYLDYIFNNTQDILTEVI